MSRPFKGAVIRPIIFAAALVVTVSSHGGTINLQVPLWEQVRQLECREYSRHVCYPKKLTCPTGSGSAVWDVDFSRNHVFSRTLNLSFTIKGYTHEYYDLLGTALNAAILNYGALMEFHGFNESDTYVARLRLLRNLADSIVVIDFECQQPGGTR